MARPEQGWNEKQDGTLRMTPLEQLAQDPLLPDAVLTTGRIPGIVPLGKLVAAVCESARQGYRNLAGGDFYTESVEGIVIKAPVLSGDDVWIYLNQRPVGEAGYSVLDLGVKLEVGGKTVGTIGTLTIRQGQDPTVRTDNRA